MASQGLHQSLKQAQSLVLAPQLRQSLKILQVPALELRNTILEELQSNPTLEELTMEGISLEEATSDTKDKEPQENDAELQLSDEDYSTLNRLSEDFREYFAQDNAGQTYTSEDAERRQHFFDSLVSETSLQEHLLQQAHFVELSPTEKEAMEHLIGSINDHGFLSSTPSDIALQANLPLRDVQRSLEILRSFDPPGIGASDLKECLIIQLRLKSRGSSLAARIIREHYDLLLRRRIPDIARKTSSSISDVENALEEIATLDPAPGRRFAEDSNRVIIPDVIVEKDNGDWHIILNNDYIPRLRISSTYKDIIARGNLSSKDREYLREKIRSGKFLINAIEQRQQTIERITAEILKYQKDFFEEGVSRLKPLTMNQIAQEVDVHETTVSRAIANKYIQTPHGIFEFKYFFTPGYTGTDGQALSNKSVKDRIAQIIAAENPAKPLSDKDIVDILASEDVTIARRTIAKYREELGILPTNLRRRYH